MIGRVARIFSRTVSPKYKEFKINIIDYNSNFFVSEITIKERILKFELSLMVQISFGIQLKYK